jgi:hypothetical protein
MKKEDYNRELYEAGLYDHRTPMADGGAAALAFIRSQEITLIDDTSVIEN